MLRRRWALAAIASAVLCSRAFGAAEREVRISAKRFEFTPREVTLKRGEAVVLVLTSEDRIHGFKQVALDLRAEIVPGRETMLRFTPSRAGRFPFFCDIFCGDGHEDMDGVLIVEG